MHTFILFLAFLSMWWFCGQHRPVLPPPAPGAPIKVEEPPRRLTSGEMYEMKRGRGSGRMFIV